MNEENVNSSWELDSNYSFKNNDKSLWKEPIEGFYALQNLIKDNLQYITGKALVKNEECQVCDTGMLEKLKSLEKENANLKIQIASFKTQY